MSNYCNKGDDCPWIKVTEEKIKSNTSQFNLFKWVVYISLGVILGLSGYDTLRQEEYVKQMGELKHEQEECKDIHKKILDKFDLLFNRSYSTAFNEHE